MPGDTRGLFITRKRKKWKFAHFAEWPNCFEARDITPAHWRLYFGNDRPLTVELGAGTADLSVELSKAHPDKNHLAIDVKSDRLYKGAKTALEQRIGNIAFVRAHADQLKMVIAVGAVEELWLTFPDPFRRKRQAKHRLTHPHFLQLYEQLLTEDGVLRFKTDNRELFLWSLEQLVINKWQLIELKFDLHSDQSTLAFDERKLTTVYERKFMADDIPIGYVAAHRPKL